MTYNGTEVTADETGKVFTLPTGDELTITATAEGVKDYNANYANNNTFEYALDNAAYYTGDKTVTVGTLSITKKTVTLTSGR